MPMTPHPLTIAWLEAQTDIFSYIDIHFARFCCRLAAETECLHLYLAALLAGHVVNHQRAVCLSLKDLGDNFSSWLVKNSFVEPGHEADQELSWPADWENFLRCHPAVASPAEAGRRRHLLVLDDEGRLYLQRYWEAEFRLAKALGARLAAKPLPLPGGIRQLADYAPRFTAADDYRQAAAVCAGLRGRLTIISGGPGCGKSSVVAAVLAARLMLAEDLRISLCAPTGLAQARLLDSVLRETALMKLPQAVSDRLQKLTASTVHRLLGYRPGAGFKFHDANHLALDLLVLDEASMVPLTLMAALFAALPPTCAVILCGDRNQLASVEAGAVLAELAELARNPGFSASFVSDLKCLSGSYESCGGNQLRPSPVGASSGLLSDNFIELRKNYRFPSGGGIARLQELVHKGSAAESDAAQAVAEVLQTDYEDLGWACLPRESEADAFSFCRRLGALPVACSAGLVEVKDFAELDRVDDVFSFWSNFRLLAPLRSGFYGVDHLNRILPAAFGLKPKTAYFCGRPLMIRQNDAQLGLYNGDLGLVWPDQAGRARVWFRRPDGDYRLLSPQRLPAHESAMAITIHKSQGSGFQRVLLCWPGFDSPLLTREMLYTAVTRAASRLDIWGAAESSESFFANLSTVAGRCLNRAGGLRSRLLEIIAC